MRQVGFSSSSAPAKYFLWRIIFVPRKLQARRVCHHYQFPPFPTSIPRESSDLPLENCGVLPEGKSRNPWAIFQDWVPQDSQALKLVFRQIFQTWWKCSKSLSPWCQTKRRNPWRERTPSTPGLCWHLLYLRVKNVTGAKIKVLCRYNTPFSSDISITSTMTVLA